jgi:multidrug efflux pump subunit AcrA (membrane-fusion protein)
VPDVALGGDQSRYVLVVNKDGVVEQRPVEPGQLVGNLRVIEKGLTKDACVQSR